MRIPAKKTLFLTGAVLAGALALGAGAAVARGWHGGGPGFGGMGGPMMLFDQFDSNKDGKITQDEIDAARDAQLKKYDRDGDGTLSLEEYQALWLDAMRPRMVRQFQANDADGNKSDLHWDLVCIQRPEYGGGEIYLDGVLVRKDGRFVLPELAGLNPENLK